MKDSDYSALLTAYQKGCVFCDVEPLLLVHRTQNFGVCLDPAPLQPGHLMLFSFEHHGCAGEVPLEHQEELDALHHAVRQWLMSEYGAITMYEHGRAGHCLSYGPEDRFCHHFHCHFVPGDHDVEDSMENRFHSVPLRSYGDIYDAYDRYGEYILYERSEGERLFFVASSGQVEPHLMRTLIADRVGEPGRADWTSYVDSRLLEAGKSSVASRPAIGEGVHCAAER